MISHPDWARAAEFSSSYVEASIGKAAKAALRWGEADYKEVVEIGQKDL